ncbi:MAG TPA: septal ring lytic transglycosylase RlpA family protein [Pseudolabrys sp.]|jgi:rare lipoprotein A|nr:septal ring lytic transglycosylase RlpA family protein [Pseudolabrys sp.]
MQRDLRTWLFANGIGLAIAAIVLCTSANARERTIWSGTAAYYSENYKGMTASGARYDPNKFTCAHRTLPFGTRLRVTDPRTHRSVVVVVNDRGPFNKGRMLDLSFAAAKILRMQGHGLIKVTATIEGPVARTSAAQ